MSEATVQALAASIYDRLTELVIDRIMHINNEEIWQIARLAAQTIEAASTIKAIVGAWLGEVDLTVGALSKCAPIYHGDSETRRRLDRWMEAVGAMQPGWCSDTSESWRPWEISGGDAKAIHPGEHHRCIRELNRWGAHGALHRCRCGATWGDMVTSVALPAGEDSE